MELKEIRACLDPSLERLWKLFKWLSRYRGMIKELELLKVIWGVYNVKIYLNQVKVKLEGLKNFCSMIGRISGRELLNLKGFPKKDQKFRSMVTHD